MKCVYKILGFLILGSLFCGWFYLLSDGLTRVLDGFVIAVLPGGIIFFIVLGLFLLMKG